MAGHHHDHDHHGHDHHGHDHGHGHGHHHAHLTGRKLAIAFFASFGVLIVLLVGGILSNSLALLADAGHVITDIAALGLSWYATLQATKPANDARTFGYHRTGILAALANAVSLILIAIWIGWEAWGRLAEPQVVHTPVMIGAAAIGLVLNLIIGFGLLAQDSEHNLNVRSAFLHVIGDAAASAGVIVGAALIWWTGLHAIDPLISVAIALFIAYGAWDVVNESVAILMEGAPPDLDVAALVADMKAIEGIREVHDLHVWSIARNMPSLSCHVLIEDDHIPRSVRVVAAATALLGEKYGIHHTTIQAEAEHCSPDSPACNIGMVQPASDGHAH